MSLTKEKVAETIKEFGGNERNSGSAEVQVALLTHRVNQLTTHLKSNTKDHHSRVGLMRLVGQRRRLLRYIQAKDHTNYQNLISKLGIRK